MLDRARNTKIKSFVFLHISLFVYSLGAVFSKKASEEVFFSCRFVAFYGIVLIILVFYAIMWQQVLKKMKLIVAYANKAVTVIWGLFWGAIIYKEDIDILNILGTFIIILGVYFVVTGEESI